MDFTHPPTSASLTTYWLRDAIPAGAEYCPPLAGRRAADVCIVGGGYTGLWTALELKRRDPAINVVVLEASICGSGASGTNAGFLMNLWPKYAALVAHVGHEEAAQIARWSSDALEDVATFACEHAPEAGFSRTGWLWAATAPTQDGAWKEVLDALAGISGTPLREVSPDRAAQLAGSGVRGGVLDPTAGTLRPAALAMALRRVAIEVGVQVYEYSPVRSVRGSSPVEVHTAAGVVTSDSVVLALNAWASAIPQVCRHLVMTASDNLVTEPLPAALTDIAGEGAAVSDSRRLLNYWRVVDDRRLLFGKGGTGLGYRGRGASSMFGPVQRPALLHAEFARTFPRLAGLAVSTWRAPVEYSVSSLPFFGSLPGTPRVFVGTGYSGDGVGPSRLGGRILASLATDADDQWSNCGLTRWPTASLPPEPLRFLGGQLVKAALLRTERAVDAGRHPGPVAAGVAKLDPTTWV